MIRKWLCAAGAVVVLLSGCGGGGGGGDEAVASSVSLSLATPKIEETTYEGRAPGAVYVSFKVAGDVRKLDGKTIYVKVESPDVLFQGEPDVTFSERDSTADVLLKSRSVDLLSPGTHQGELTISACLDLACQVHLGNSPFKVPYTIQVAAKIALSTYEIHRDIAFGQEPQDEVLTLTLPPEAGGQWDLIEEDESLMTVTRGPNATVNVDLHVVAPGTYTRDILVSTLLPSPDGGYDVVFTTAKLTYIVRDSGAPVALVPGHMTESFPFNSGVVGRLVEPIPVFAVAGTLNISEVVHLTAPAAATGNPALDGWVTASDEWQHVALSTVSGESSGRVPLPVGTYTAVVRYRHVATATGAVSYVDFPVSMTITP